jgi:hypothetical protein
VNFNMPQSKRTTTTGFRCWLVWYIYLYVWF